MKILLVTTILVTTFGASAFAQEGNIAGTESRGEPINSSVRASAIDPRTGLTPGGRASHSRAYVKKEKRARRIGGPAYVSPTAR
jgi:hypothetical protein